jgi:hypothetical protein
LGLLWLVLVLAVQCGGRLDRAGKRLLLPNFPKVPDFPVPDFRISNDHVTSGFQENYTMKQFLLSMYQPAGGPPPPEVLGKIMRDLDEVNQEIKAAGAWVFAGGLPPLHITKVARIKDGAVITTDGPFAETKEFLGGIYIILAPNLAAALDWGGKIARATTLPIEVRPFQDRSEA